MVGKSEVDCIAKLRAHGLQVTFQRLAIYRLLLDSTEHPSADEIYRKVQKRFPMISLGTVYKSLEKFQEAGLVQRACAMTDVSRYEAKTDSHHHMFCVKCQTIQDIDDPIRESKLILPEGHSFEILGHDVIIRGYCSECAGK